MTGRTISSVIANGVTLASTDNPLTITLGGTVTNAGANAVQATGTLDWTIDNTGSISATGTNSVGISLTENSTVSAGGTITNEPGGTISPSYSRRGRDSLAGVA